MAVKDTFNAAKVRTRSGQAREMFARYSASTAFTFASLATAIATCIPVMSAIEARLATADWGTPQGQGTAGRR